ncbi:MAG: autoinducer synthase [Sphingomonas sp.]|nr:autoinducer synthase [Sphingomonas sp.]
MTHVICGGGGVSEDALFAQMFQERKRVFIDLLGWDLPALAGRYEVDQFDIPETRYIICASAQGEHLGSLRLLPCSGPNLLGLVFPFLCDGDAPCAPDIWEISRLCLSRSIRACERRFVRDQLATAVTLFALEQGIRAYCCVADMPWYGQLLSFGWRCEPLGLPQPIDKSMIAALKILIDDDTPALMAAAGVWSPSSAPLGERTH